MGAVKELESTSAPSSIHFLKIIFKFTHRKTYSLQYTVSRILTNTNSLDTLIAEDTDQGAAKLHNTKIVLCVASSQSSSPTTPSSQQLVNCPASHSLATFKHHLSGVRQHFGVYLPPFSKMSLVMHPYCGVQHLFVHLDCAVVVHCMNIPQLVQGHFIPFQLFQGKLFTYSFMNHAFVQQEIIYIFSFYNLYRGWSISVCGWVFTEVARQGS